MPMRSFPPLTIGLSFFVCFFFGQCYGQSLQEANSANPIESVAIPFFLQIPSEQHGTSVAEILHLPVENESDTVSSSGVTSTPGEYYVILFDGSQMKHLPSRTEFHDDLKALKETVVAAGVPEKNIIMCSGEETGTRNGFGNTILAIAEKAKRNDFILVAMQGYATHLDGIDYILPYDTNPNDIRNAVRAPEELANNYRKNFIPVQAMLNLLAQDKKTNDSDKCRKILVLINPYSVDPADVAQLTVKETFPTIPFGHQEWILPTGTIAVTSRALRLMPENHALLDASTSQSLRTTVFMRIVLEGLSGLARQADSDSKQPVTVGEFLTFLNNRSEIQDFAKPNIRFHTDFQFRMFPYFEAPPMIQKIRQDIVAQIQVNHYRTGLFLLFNQQDPQSSSFAFANCEGMTQDKSLAELARQMRFCSYLAFGDIPRLMDENTEKQSFPTYVVQQTQIFDSPDGQPLTFTAPVPQNQPAQTAAGRNTRRTPQYNASSSINAGAAKKLELLPGDRIDVFEVVQTKVDNDTENSDSTENDTTGQINFFDQRERELHHRTENAWVHIRKVERLKMKSYANYDESGRQTGAYDGVFEEVLSGQQSIQGWVPADAFNFIVFKYHQDKTLFDSLEKIRATLDMNEVKKTRQVMTSSAPSVSQSGSPQTPTPRTMPQQSAPRPGQIINRIPGIPSLPF
ncbi:MAG: hypothetical protein FWC50_07040 [Planctomycetaceae bacterium]|nr:hypothetical protein [Planctomycetaceae bacterium]